MESKSADINKKETVVSPALPGEPLSIEAFEDWVKKAEEYPTYTLKEARDIWVEQKLRIKKQSECHKAH